MYIKSIEIKCHLLQFLKVTKVHTSNSAQMIDGVTCSWLQIGPAVYSQGHFITE
jgi:hypothetical protein